MNNSKNLVLSITAAAIAVAENMTDDEITLLAALATQFADTLLTIAAARELAER